MRLISLSIRNKITRLIISVHDGSRKYRVWKLLTTFHDMTGISVSCENNFERNAYQKMQNYVNCFAVLFTLSRIICIILIESNKEKHNVQIPDIKQISNCRTYTVNVR